MAARGVGPPRARRRGAARARPRRDAAGRAAPAFLSLRIVHVADAPAGRGGAHVHLDGLLRWQRARHEVHLVSGGGFAARSEAAVDLAPVRDLRPDVVHVHTVVNPVALHALGGTGSVLTVQDHRYFCPGRGKWTLSGETCPHVAGPERCAACFEDADYAAEVGRLTAERLAGVKTFGAVLVLSRYMRDELVAAGVDAGRVHVVPPLVDPIPPALPDGPPCVLFVGRLAEHKGVRDAVLAWKRSGVDLPLVFAGTGPLRTWAEAQGAQVPGWLPRERLGAVYARAAALLMPSRWQEPFGIAGVEALRVGVPVVAWRSGGIPEWHPGGDLLVEWGDVEGLAQALRLAVTQRASAPGGYDADVLGTAVDAVYASL